MPPETRASATLPVYSPMSGSSSSPSTSAKKLSCSARSWAKAAALVAMAEGQGCDLQDLTLEQMQTAHGEITAAVFDVLGVEQSVPTIKYNNGTAPAQVLMQIKRWEAKLK